MEVAQKNYLLDNQPPQIICILGGPGSGKGTQCERLVRDFKFRHISVGDVMRAEIKSQSKEGLRIKAIVEKGAIVPTELTVGLLLKAIKSYKDKFQRFLIDGFPRGLEQALRFEASFRPLDFIINFDVPEETLVDRLSARAQTSGRADDNPETIRERIRVFYESTQPVIELYKKLGKIANIDGQGEIEEIYERVRLSIVPNLIFFYGAPAVGKKIVAEKIAEKTGYEYLNLKEFYRQNKCQNDVDKLNKLIKYLGNSTYRNYVIDNFLENKAQAVLLFQHFGKPRYVIYFESTKDEIQDNIRRYSSNDCEVKERMKIFKEFLQNRDAMLQYFNQFSFFKSINAIDSVENMTKQVIELIKPQVLASVSYNNEELAEDYIKLMERELNYVRLDVESLCEDEEQRGTMLGNQMAAFIRSGQVVPPKMQCELLRKIFFNSPINSKFLLQKFPERKNEFDIFEKNLFSLAGFLNFMKPGQKLAYSSKQNPQLQYVAKGKHLIINSQDLEVLTSFTTKKTEYGIVCGPSCSGKTTLGKYIANKFGYTFIEWEATINLLKEKLGPPGEPLEEVPLPKIIEYYRNLFSGVLKEKFLFDGFPPGCDSKNQQDDFYSIGQPTWTLYLSITKEDLWKRYKLKNELDAAQELTPEDEEKIATMMNAGQQQESISDSYVQSHSSSKLFKLDVNNSLEFTQSSVDYIYEKRLFTASLLCETSFKAVLKLVYVNVAAQKNMLFLDTDEFIDDKMTPQQAVEAIKERLTDVQDVLLWGYPRAKGDTFPRASDEIYALEKNIGPVRMVNIIEKEDIQVEINDPKWELVKPEEPEKVVENPDDGDKPPEDDENKVPQLNIYEYEWTKSDGIPKNLAQIYNQLKLPQRDNIEISEYNAKIIYDSFLEYLETINENRNSNYMLTVKLDK